MPDIFSSATDTVKQVVARKEAVQTQPSHREVEDYSEVMRQEREGKNPFAAFIPKPDSISFDSQGAAEKVLLVLRRHPITQVSWLFIVILAAFAPILFSLAGVLSFLPYNYRAVAVIGWYMLLTGYSLEKVLQWFFNVYIITDERIVDVDFISLIYKNISAAKIDKIEDVTAVTGGAIQSMVNFGTVRIQTAAEKNEFEFDEVPQPAKVTRFLNELMLEEEREKIEGRVS
ncbi:PH domain-containing protein [Candidatus Woesebacteria bacterium]|nr:PH domain-containing protein [Candidatus Woesebacteria bacterium]